MRALTAATGKPASAISRAGASSSASPSRPSSAAASAHSATAPGTVTGSPPRAGMSSCPRARIASIVAPRPARPAPSSARTRPVAASRWSRNASPPGPVIIGESTAIAAAIATHASAAVPPASSMRIPASAARGCSQATAPAVP